MSTPSALVPASITSSASRTHHLTARSLAEAEKARMIVQPRLFSVRSSPDAPARARMWNQSGENNA
ncbi:hypothetical protein [Streptomyces sp. NPDC056975]|uniref:hypothetical protein n=1 Tax=unclassified Streptomyces TaxID=2593676 RepID=UPI0036293F01